MCVQRESIHHPPIERTRFADELSRRRERRNSVSRELALAGPRPSADAPTARCINADCSRALLNAPTSDVFSAAARERGYQPPVAKNHGVKALLLAADIDA